MPVSCVSRILKGGLRPPLHHSGIEHWIYQLADRIAGQPVPTGLHLMLSIRGHKHSVTGVHPRVHVSELGEEQLYDFFGRIRSVSRENFVHQVGYKRVPQEHAATSGSDRSRLTKMVRTTMEAGTARGARGAKAARVARAAKWAREARRAKGETGNPRARKSSGRQHISKPMA